MEITFTPILSHHKREFGQMCIFMLLKSGIYHNAIVIMPLINVSKNVSIHGTCSSVVFFFVVVVVGGENMNVWLEKQFYR